MTAETDLLPLRDWMECLGEINAEDIRDYARANVAHAVAPLQAEVEALRAEVATWEGLHASEVQVRQRWQARAERLAEALRDAADDLERGIDARIVVAQARAALRDHDQEDRND